MKVCSKAVIAVSSDIIVLSANVVGGAVDAISLETRGDATMLTVDEAIGMCVSS